jgi:hypothetical protein
MLVQQADAVTPNLRGLVTTSGRRSLAVPRWVAVVVAKPLLSDATAR